MKRSNTFIALLSIAGLVLTAPIGLMAQANNWTSVKALQRGMELIVIRKSNDRVIGYVDAVTDDTLAVTSDTGSFVIGKDNVDKIYIAIPRDRMKHMNRGALVGGLLGLAAGIAVSIAMSPESEAMPGLPIMLAGGAAGGWFGSQRAKGKDKGPLVYSAK